MTDPPAWRHGGARLVIRCAPLLLPFFLITPLLAPTVTLLTPRPLPITAPSARVSVAVTGVRPQAAPLLGILTSATALEITGVLPSSPADRAGLRAGDIVRSIDSVPVAHPEDLARLLHSRPAGDRVVLGIVRASRQLGAHVILDPDPVGGSQAPGPDAW